MRIATTQFQATMNRSLQMNQHKISQLTQQMASGKQIELPSDDPLTTVRLARLGREESTISQYRENIAAAKVRMQKSETYLSGMNVDMQEARDLLVWSSDGGSTSADLNAMVNSLTALRDSLFYSANVKDLEGSHVFSGTATGTAAIGFNGAALAGSRYSYTGNSGRQEVTVGNGVRQATNADVGGLETLLNQLDVTINALKVPGVSPNDPAVRTIVRDNLDGVDTAMNTMSSKIAIFGGAQNILSTLDGNHSDVSLSNKIAFTELSQLDYGVAASELNGYNLALQSTYKAYSKVSELSLFNVL